MTSTYVNDLRLNEQGTGDNPGSWGTVTNTNLELIAEAFSYGTETIGNADTTITLADGASDAARSLYLKIASSADLTTTRVITLAPNTVSKVWIIENATSGGQVITIKQGSGATVNIPNGSVKVIATDGSGSGGIVYDLFTDLDVAGTFAVAGNTTVGGTLGVTGALTANAGVVVDNITIDGTEIDLSSGDLTIDVAGDLVVNADGGNLVFQDDSVNVGELANYHDGSSHTSDFVVAALTQDKDILLRGNDGGSTITALQLDMSNSGFAFFNANAFFNEAGIDTDFRIKSQNNTNMFYVDASTDRIGIGTSTPTFDLTVQRDDDETYDKDAFPNATVHVFKRNNSGSANQYATLRFQCTNDNESTNAQATINLVKTSSSGHHSTLTFQTRQSGGNMAEAMRVDDSQRLIVGKTSNSSSAAGTTLYSNGKIEGVRDGDIVHSFNRLSSGGNIVSFQQDGSTAGIIGSSSTSLFIGNDDAGILFNDHGGGDLDSILPYDVGSAALYNGHVDIGGSSNKFKDAHFSGTVDCAKITYDSFNDGAGNSGLNVVARYSYDDNNTNTIGSNFNNGDNMLYVTSNAGATSIPMNSNGGSGIAWDIRVYDPDNHDWSSLRSISFTQAGTGGNTFTISFQAGTSAGSITRTSGSLAYQVYVSRRHGGT